MSTTTKKVRITQVRSGIGQIKRQKLTLRALGITKMGHSAVHDDTPAVRGMIRTVEHLVTVEEARGE